MTREEKIEQALESYQQRYDNGTPESITAYNEGYDDGFEAGFREGAAWVEANPCWHKCEDEMPQPNVKVLCYTSNGTYIVAWQKEVILGGNTPSGKYKWSLWKCPIIAWMELPQPPKFD